MSKRAEERALKAYPEDIQLFVESQEEPGKWLPVDENIQFRYGYKQGYEQAEKDLAPLIEAATIVYEAWNGGTMDDVRKAMAELGNEPLIKVTSKDE